MTVALPKDVLSAERAPFCRKSSFLPKVLSVFRQKHFCARSSLSVVGRKTKFLFRSPTMIQQHVVNLSFLTPFWTENGPKRSNDHCVTIKWSCTTSWSQFDTILDMCRGRSSGQRQSFVDVNLWHCVLDNYWLGLDWKYALVQRAYRCATLK